MESVESRFQEARPRVEGDGRPLMWLGERGSGRGHGFRRRLEKMGEGGGKRSQG